MLAITGLSSVGVARGPLRPRSGASFSMPDAAGAEAAEATSAAAPIEMPALLAMQEAYGEPVQDREARRHGKAMLDALTKLQRALLGGEGPDGLQSLANLLRATPEASDPRLAAVQRAVLVRAAVELQRSRMQLAE